MQATLTFQLPEEQSALNLALKAQDLRGVLEDLDNHLRQQVKHVEMPTARRAALEDVRDMLHQFLSDREVKLE